MAVSSKPFPQGACDYKIINVECIIYWYLSIVNLLLVLFIKADWHFRLNPLHSTMYQFSADNFVFKCIHWNSCEVIYNSQTYISGHKEWVADPSFRNELDMDYCFLVCQEKKIWYNCLLNIFLIHSSPFIAPWICI